VVLTQKNSRICHTRKTDCEKAGKKLSRFSQRGYGKSEHRPKRSHDKSCGSLRSHIKVPGRLGLQDRTGTHCTGVEFKMEPGCDVSLDNVQGLRNSLWCPSAQLKL
jgi:hypothetical protein